MFYLTIQDRFVNWSVFLLVTCGVLFTAATPCHTALTPDSIEETIGAERGICVILGENLGDRVLELARSSEVTFYVQSSDAGDVLQSRKEAAAEGLLSTRLYIEQGDSSRIHLADNLADAVIVSDRSGFKKAELFRVLLPGGKLITDGKVQLKPVLNGLGQWTHPYHGPDNNPLSEDRVAKAPFITQFLAEPYYGPMPAVTVTSGGRLFKAFGHISFKKREWAMVGKLVAMNAFNGVILWQRELTPGFMIHRNTMIATPDTLYLADNESCKAIDAVTGKILSEIVLSKEVSNGPAWKWMALSDGVLYALAGQPDKIDKVLYGVKKTAGWPWTGLGTNYAKLSEDYPWGFGRTMLAIDLKTQKVLWHTTKENTIDGRAFVMKGNRIYAYSHQHDLAAIDARTGKDIWRTSDKELLEAIGHHDPAQTWKKGYASQIYLSASDKALYFAGPQRTKTVAVSTDDGKMLWNYPDGNVQLILRDDRVYAFGKTGPSKKLHPLTGEILADLSFLRGNCTRVTGTADSIFARGDEHGGTLRVDMTGDTPSRLPAMRPACQDGVIAANGLLYWGPWMCDCNHSLVGVISLSPAGDFDFSQSATEGERLETFAGASKKIRSLKLTKADWPTYRKNNQRTSQTPATVGRSIERLWEFTPQPGIRRTAPVTVDELTFVSGSDGIVYALDNQTGHPRWTSYTGGSVQYPPSYWKGRLYIGSADGWVYAFEAATGQSLWRFRAAPVERKIPVYGSLASTWPVTSVLVEDGVVYAAAGIASHDGTHVYALDAKTGKILWQNNTSGHLMGESKVAGVSVQGHLLLHGKKLYLAGGNAVSPGIYDTATGQCLNTLTNEWQKAPRGKELFSIGGQVRVFDQMLYAPRSYIPSRYHAKYLLTAGDDSEIAYQGTEKEMMCIQLGGGQDGKAKTLWQRSGFVETAGVVVAKDAILTIGGVADKANENEIRQTLTLLDPSDGTVIESKRLPAPPASWGLAIDREGRILAATENGQLICYRSTTR